MPLLISVIPMFSLGADRLAEFAGFSRICADLMPPLICRLSCCHHIDVVFDLRKLPPSFLPSAVHLHLFGSGELFLSEIVFADPLL